LTLDKISKTVLIKILLGRFLLDFSGKDRTITHASAKITTSSSKGHGECLFVVFAFFKLSWDSLATLNDIEPALAGQALFWSLISRKWCSPSDLRAPGGKF
jgi:hypothetical protein